VGGGGGWGGGVGGCGVNVCKQVNSLGLATKADFSRRAKNFHRARQQPPRAGSFFWWTSKAYAHPRHVGSGRQFVR